MTTRVEVSGREAEVLAALAAGQANAQIANRLHLSVRTVEGHVSALLRKYGVGDRRALAEIAADLPVEPPPGQVAGLPGWRTSFVGRVAEQAEVSAALAAHGLVTLTGPGGAGKTRLAVRVAETVSTGGTFVDLVTAREATVPQVVAAALGVAETPHRPLEAAIFARLRRGPGLLLLDNCEHVIEAAAGFAARVLDSCPMTTVLATSRERLAIDGEHVVGIGPLPLGADAEELFAQRASSAAADAATVAEVCARLDGLPLAIELAAARCGALGPRGVLTGLGDRLRLLAGGRGMTERHRSVRAVLAWSHDLLDDDERALFRALGAFAGEFDLAAAAIVSATAPPVAADLLGRLVDKSLVAPCRDRTSRWRLLETVRDFAVERLAGSADEAVVRQRHLRWAADVAATLRDRFGGRWAAEFDAVAGELRVALDAAPPGPEEQVHRLAALLARLTFARRFLAEAVERYREAAARTTAPHVAAAHLVSAAECAQLSSDYDLAFGLFSEAAERAGSGEARALALARAVETAGRYEVIFREPVPPSRLAALLAAARDVPGSPVLAARLAIAEAWTGDATPSRALTAAEATGEPVHVVAALDACRAAAEPAEAHRFAVRRLDLAQRLDPTDPAQAAERDDALGRASLEAVVAGDIPTAKSVAALTLRDEPTFLNLIDAIPAHVLSGDLGQAAGYADSMWADWQRSGRPRVHWMWVTLPFVVLAHGLRGDRDAAASWWARLDDLTGTPAPGQIERLRPLSAFVTARLALHTGALDDAAELVAHVRTLTTGRYLTYAWSAVAELAVAAALPGAEDVLTEAALRGGTNEWAAATLARATGRLRGDPVLLADSASRWERMGAKVEHACTLLLVPGRAAEGRAELAALGALIA